MQDRQNIEKKAVQGIGWKLAEKIGMQGVQFVIQIVLARILLPEEYGIVGLLSIFITISDIFIQQGLTTALIQNQEADEVDFSSVFYANIIAAIILYVILYVYAPAIANFYNEPLLIEITRVLSLNIIIGALSAVHNAVLTKALLFKKIFVRNFSNAMTQGIVGILLANFGWGAWALVYSKIAGVLVGTVILWITVKWHPVVCFSIKRIKKLFSYSSKVLSTNLLNALFSNMHSLVIGRHFSSAELGFYQRGQQIPQVAMGVFDASLNEVLYPTLSILQDDKLKFKETLRKSMKLSTFIAMPILSGIFSVTEPLVLVLLTEKWLACVPYMKLSCIVCAFWPFAARTYALNAMGKSEVTLKMSIISKALTLIFIVVSVPLGIYAIMLSTICASFISTWITSYYCSKYIGYSGKEFLSDILPSIGLAIVMMIVVLIIGRWDINVYVRLLVQIVSGGMFYLCGAKILKIDSLEYTWDMLKRWRED